jgi:predicted metalloendopeptidase
VQAIASNVIEAFRQRVAAVTWLSPASKKQALAKLQTVYFGVGYPEKWDDYSDLRVDAADPIGNLQRLADWRYEQALARVGAPVDVRQWWIAPQTAGAILTFQQNAYNFSAALLQAPKFDPTASDAMNYGAIGAIIGHEVSHFVDTLGADYDAARRKLHWWTAEDMAGYEAATRPLVEQFSNYRPLPDVAIDGKRTLVENVADLGGLAAAFDAYRRTLGSKASDKQYVKQLDREFFIGFARSWRGKARQEALREQLATDGHAPESFRIATVRNLDAWYDAFDVKPGQALYLEPKARVKIW